MRHQAGCWDTSSQMYTNVTVPFSSRPKMHERHIELGPVVLGGAGYTFPDLQRCRGGGVVKEEGREW